MALCSVCEPPGGESVDNLFNSHANQVQGKPRRALAQSLRLGIREDVPAGCSPSSKLDRSWGTLFFPSFFREQRSRDVPFGRIEAHALRKLRNKQIIPLPHEVKNDDDDDLGELRD